MATENTGSSCGSKQAPEAVLERRTRILSGVLKQFLADWQHVHNSTHTLPPKQQAKGKQAAKAAAAKKAPPISKSKKAAVKDPKDECLAKLMAELDDRINKAKKCKLDDVYSAILQLNDQEQQVLASILSAYGSKLLGDKANEASMAIRDCLCSAAAAHQYCRPQVPEASKCSAAAYRQQGLPARSGLDAGFTAGQLLRAGYSTAELVQSGAGLEKLRAAGISVDDLFAHLPPAELSELSGTAGAAKLRAAGYTAVALQEGAAARAFSSWDLKLVGFSVPVSTQEVAAVPAAAVAGGVSPRSRLPGGALQQRQQAQQQQVQAAAAAQQAAVQYFRHQVIPLMQMKAEQDVAPLLLHSSERAAARAAMAPTGVLGEVGVASASSFGPTASRRAATRTSSSASRATAAQRIVKWQLPLGEEPSGSSSRGQKPAAAGGAAAAAAAAADSSQGQGGVSDDAALPMSAL